MNTISDMGARAELVAGIHAPWNATVSECLTRWAALGSIERSRSYLVLRGEAGARRTLNASAIGELTRQIDKEHQHLS
ncbi:hypothetical protein [Sphingomonas sp. NBWT7]|uniref:hypothetical protein n=1 Tax=Sphingomonas sp. NBWT7 TaxID=2596913 RepID=UPI0016297386|nr:hypothetical protein [Sphingomonas sp. NBWT7]